MSSTRDAEVTTAYRIKVLWLAIVSARTPRAGLKFLGKVGIGSEALEDETAPIPVTLWHRALRVFCDSGHAELLDSLRTPTHPACLAAWAAVLRGTQLPVQAFAQLSDHGGVVPTEHWITERLSEVRWEGSVLAGTTDPIVEPLCRAARESELACVPMLFGLPRAHVRSESADGRQHFVATWHSPSVLPAAVAGVAMAAGVVAVEAALRRSQGTVPEALGALGFGAGAGILIALAAGRRRISKTLGIRIGALERAAKLRDRARREPTGLETGRVVAGRYRLGRRLGVGASSAIWDACRLSDGMPVAVKLLKTSAKHDIRAVDRLHREARALARVSHPNVVQLEQEGELGDGSVFLVLQRLQGETLASVLERMGALPLGAVMSIAIGLCDALQAVHTAGVVHRDVKPANVYVSWTPRGQPHVTLLDFGVAKVAWDDAELTEPGIALGTLGFMAPEQRLGQAVDGRTDLYALGCVLFECATGHAFRPQNTNSEPGTPLAPTDERLRRSSLPKRWRFFLTRVLAINPQDRFQSAAEMRESIAALDAAPNMDGAQ